MKEHKLLDLGVAVARVGYMWKWGHGGVFEPADLA
jgi:hypothetical protein